MVKANQAMQPLCELAKVRTREQAAVLAAVNFAFQNQALQKHIQQQLLATAANPRICTAPTAAEQARLNALVERLDRVLAPTPTI